MSDNFGVILWTTNTNKYDASIILASFTKRQHQHSFPAGSSHSFLQKGISTMNQYPIRYAFRLDSATEAALEQIARHTFQSKASIMRRYVQEGTKRDMSA